MAAGAGISFCAVSTALPAGACERNHSTERAATPAATPIPAIQTTIGRLEGKKAVARIKKIGNAYIYEATVSRSSAQRRLVDDLLALFGGRSQPVMTHLIEAGKLSLEDVQQAEKLVREMAQEKKP